VKPRPLILVTDAAYPDDRICEVVEAVGVAVGSHLIVQLRDKTRPRPAIWALARRLRDQTIKSGSLLVINGDALLAHEVGADGVHLGRDAATVAEVRAQGAAWISVAAHDDSDVVRAQDDEADAVLVSPIFATPGKGPPRGPTALRRARARRGDGEYLAIYALGGVDVGNAQSCRDAGADGLAVIRALLGAADPGAVARALVAPFVPD
jgi:thiamine-phosphate pyrophosphorylase